MPLTLAMLEQILDESQVSTREPITHVVSLESVRRLLRLVEEPQEGRPMRQGVLRERRLCVENVDFIVELFDAENDNFDEEYPYYVEARRWYPFLPQSEGAGLVCAYHRNLRLHEANKCFHDICENPLDYFGPTSPPDNIMWW